MGGGGFQGSKKLLKIILVKANPHFTRYTKCPVFKNFHDLILGKPEPVKSLKFGLNFF